jgi:integrase
MPEPEKRLRNGRTRWYARYYDPSGNRHTKVFDTKAEADRFLTTVSHSKITGSYVDPNRSKVTVGVLADQWLEAKLDLTPKTRERYEGIIGKHIRPTWGNSPLAAVRHADVQRWLARLDLAPASVRKVHRVLSMILAYAVRDGRLATNPAAGVSLPRVRQAERRYLTHEQLAALADACPERYGLLVRFLAYTGLRFGEAAALRVHRIDFLRRRVVVAESVTPVGGRPVFGPAKGHERREVALPNFLINDLARHVKGKTAEDLVFTGARGQVLRPQGFQRAALTAAAERIGVPGFHPHELRHTAASLAIASGADIKIVQQMLGHKSATMTLDQYGHLFGDRLDIVADAMEAARTSALPGGYPMGSRGEVVELRPDAK